MEDVNTPPELLVKLLAASGGLVLVGGQALAFWMVRYDVGLPPGVLVVSRDTDFLATSAGDREVVYRLANAIHGRAIFPPARALTALVGQAVKVISDNERINVDVIFKIHGSNEERVRKSAIEIKKGDTVFYVMHPLHVLKSRLDNLYSLADKQAVREKSEMQLRCAIRVAQRFLINVAASGVKTSKNRSAVLHHIKLIETMALSDAGRKVTARHGIHVADAIEPAVVQSPDFRQTRLPQLLKLMSSARQEEISATR